MITEEAAIERHPFEPFLPEGAKVLMLGSFPPQRKRWSMEFYYPNWLNDFWRVCGLVFYGDKDHFVVAGQKRFDLEMIKAFCREKGIALYDTATEVRRLQDNASDKFLEVVTPTDLPALLARIPSCRALVTTGQKATDVLLSSAQPAVAASVTAPKVEAPKVGGQTAVEAQPAAATSVTAPRVEAPRAGGQTAVVIAGRRLDFWRMPSTSRAYPLSLDRKAAAYRTLFASLGLLPHH